MVTQKMILNGSLLLNSNMPKRTYQPKTRRANREHGFMSRMQTKSGRNVLKQRREKGRAKIAKHAA